MLAAVVAACAPVRERQPKPAAGDSLYASGDYDAARTAYRGELERGNSSRTERAHVLTSIGLAAYHLGDYDEARRVTDSALAIQQSGDASAPESFRTHNAMGLVAWNQGRLAAADTLFRVALRVATDAHDTSAIAKASSNLGLVLTELRGDVDAGYFEKILSPGTTIQPATVDGVVGYWISGRPHELVFVNPSGEPVFDSRRIVGDTLIWAKDGITYRLETALDRDEAVALANALR